MSNVTECACKTKDILSDRCTVLHLPSSEHLSIIFGIILAIKVTVTKYGKVESMHHLRQSFFYRFNEILNNKSKNNFIAQ